MNVYRKWSFLLIASLALLIMFNFTIWQFFTEDILTFEKYCNGDLTRMGYISGSKHYRKYESTLPRKHIENTDYTGRQHVDVVTLGDSFSNAKSGKDPFYQDWIASLHDLDVLNVQPLRGKTQFETAIVLLNSGYLAKVRPRFLILESVERFCCTTDFSRNVDFQGTMALDAVEQYYRDAKCVSNYPKTSFINTGNFKFVRNAILYEFSDHAFNSPVYARDLIAPLFSVKNDRRLIFLNEDIKNIQAANEQAVNKFNENLNVLANLLAKQGIALYFMPAPDKYNMYRDYIVNNPYPKSTFFELMRPLPKKYIFVDTKAILSQAIKNGEKDIYYADDTHWSWKAVKKIVLGMRFEGRI
jgi:hypothetical protein